MAGKRRSARGAVITSWATLLVSAAPLADLAGAPLSVGMWFAMIRTHASPHWINLLDGFHGPSLLFAVSGLVMASATAMSHAISIRLRQGLLVSAPWYTSLAPWLAIATFTAGLVWANATTSRGGFVVTPAFILLALLAACHSWLLIRAVRRRGASPFDAVQAPRLPQHERQHRLR